MKHQFVCDICGYLFDEDGNPIVDGDGWAHPALCSKCEAEVADQKYKAQMADMEDPDTWP